jgi:hypothetical protein
MNGINGMFVWLVADKSNEQGPRILTPTHKKTSKLTLESASQSSPISTARHRIMAHRQSPPAGAAPHRRNPQGMPRRPQGAAPHCRARTPPRGRTPPTGSLCAGLGEGRTRIAWKSPLWTVASRERSPAMLVLRSVFSKHAVQVRRIWARPLGSTRRTQPAPHTYSFRAGRRRRVNRCRLRMRTAKILAGRGESQSLAAFPAHGETCSRSRRLAIHPPKKKSNSRLISLFMPRSLLNSSLLAAPSPVGC